MDNVTETKRPYAGQAWRAGLMSGPLLQILAKDLMDDARQHGVTGDVIELWVNKITGSKGFFIGDTSGLTGQGWVKEATL